MATQEWKKQVGRKLAAARTARGWKLAEAAEKLGYGHKTVSMAEHGDRLTQAYLEHAAKVYGVPLDHLTSPIPPDEKLSPGKSSETRSAIAKAVRENAPKNRPRSKPATRAVPRRASVAVVRTEQGQGTAAETAQTSASVEPATPAPVLQPKSKAAAPANAAGMTRDQAIGMLLHDGFLTLDDVIAKVTQQQ